MTTPTNLYFFAEFYKKGPAGSEKQVIYLVWPYKILWYYPHVYTTRVYSFTLVYITEGARPVHFVEPKRQQMTDTKKHNV